MQKIAIAKNVLINIMTTALFHVDIPYPVGRGWNGFRKLLFATGPSFWRKNALGNVSCGLRFQPGDAAHAAADGRLRR
jgi:hypothetical protein